MRKSVLSVSIALFFIVFSPPVLALPADKLPGYANERFYPDSVRTVQEEPSWWEQTFCQWFGGFISFGCQAVRTQHILSPENLKAEVNEPDAVAANPGLSGSSTQNITGSVQSISTEELSEILSTIEQEIDTADSLEQVLGVADILASIFGGGETGTGFINTYKPSSVSLCDDSSNAQDCTEKLAIALLPASLQKKTVAQRLITEQPSGSVAVTPIPIPSGPVQGPLPDPNPTFPVIGGRGGGNDLIAGFQRYCAYNGTPGRVHKTNVDCLSHIVPRLSPGAISEMRNSAVAYTNLQCVGFVRGINIQLKGKVLDNGGNAIDFATNIPTGYRLIRKALVTSPKAGDLLLWNTGTFGHIAYISVVHDNNFVGVLEANWGTPGKVQYRNVDVRAADILGWLTQ